MELENQVPESSKKEDKNKEKEKEKKKGKEDQTKKGVRQLLNQLGRGSKV